MDGVKRFNEYVSETLAIGSPEYTKRQNAFLQLSDVDKETVLRNYIAVHYPDCVEELENTSVGEWAAYNFSEDEWTDVYCNFKEYLSH